MSEFFRDLHSCGVFIQVLFFIGTSVLWGFQPSFPDQAPRVQHIGQEQGLSQVTINQLIKDHQGFVWIGTQDGLNRYDGNQMQTFRSQASDSLSIPGNFIQALQEDHHKRIWVGTRWNGLCFYDRNQEVFIPVKLQFSNHRKETITDIKIDSQASLWVSSKLSGLHRIQLDHKQGFKQSHYFSDHPISAIYVDDNQQIWVGDYEGNVYTKANQLETFQKTGKVEGQIRTFYSAKGTLFIGSDSGVFQLGVSDFQMEKITYKAGNTLQFVNDFLFLDKNRFYIATGNGVYTYDMGNQKIEPSFTPNESKTPLSNYTIHSFLRLNAHQILVGSANNLNLINQDSLVFNTISKNKRGVRILNDNVVFSILKDSLRLWVGTSDGGLNLIEGDAVYYYSEKTGYPDLRGTIRALVKDTVRKRLWVGTTRGLFLVDLNGFAPERVRFTNITPLLNQGNPLPIGYIKDLCLDAKGNLWGATRGAGIFKLAYSSYQKYDVEQFTDGQNSNTPISSNYINAILVGPDQGVWAGSENGLIRLDTDVNTPTRYKVTNFWPHEAPGSNLVDKVIYDLTMNHPDTLWIGTRKGLARLVKGQKMSTWTAREQFSSDIVYSVLQDEKGLVWMATNQGIVSFDGTDGFKQYTVKDGIQGNEFDLHAKHKDAHGNLYFGGVEGLSVYDPKTLAGIDFGVPLFFTSLKVHNDFVKPQDSLFPVLSESISETGHLTFQKNDFPFYLRFSSIDFRRFKDVRFAYKLNPTDSEWNFLDDTEIQFLNLPTGDYTLEINGFSRGKMWEQEPLTMSLAILPPWWASRMAYVTYFLLALLLGFWFYKFQLSRKLALAESDRLKDMDQLKTSLYTNITHEFRTPLTVISGMVAQIKDDQSSQLSTRATGSLEMIDRNGNELLGLVNDLLDLSKLDAQSLEVDWVQTDVIPYIKYLVEGFQSMAANKQIRLFTYFEESSLVMDFDAKKLGSILTNLISNAIKFTPNEGEIVVHLRKVQGQDPNLLEVKVRDTGMGIPETGLAQIFDRFYQVQDQRRKNTGGSGIGLALCKELVTIMGGDISVKSKLDHGSEFCFRLPIHHHAEHDTLELLMPGSAQKKALLLPLLQQKEQELPLALIVEDHEDVAHYLQSCLFTKYQCLYAPDGEQGIEMAQEYVPDVVISDVMMPKRDGYELCATLKQDPRTDHIPVILLTAKATHQDRLVGLEQGADAYLTKPFSKEELFTRLEQLILVRDKLREKYDTMGYASIPRGKITDPKTQFLAKMVEEIQAHIDQSAFGSRQLARAMGLSESQLYRKIKAISGKSTAIFIRSIRLKHAKTILQQGHKNVSEVAYDCGFNDPSWFSKAFKEEFGMPPSAVCQNGLPSP
ncbi:hybrid sensor histidine kinase/response regulator transcription factor [Sediminicola luteus]|nr:hybrid sensor histidine kinase/response regulator transcription factor [Sediminicola luteus]